MTAQYGFDFEDPNSQGTMPTESKHARARRRGCGMNSGMCCIRVTLILLNLIVGLVGVCIIATGAMLLFYSLNSDTSISSSGDQDVESGNDFSLFALLCIIFGAFISFITFCGFFGASVKSRCLLLTYLVMVILVVLLQLLFSVYAIFKHEPMMNSLKEEMIQTLQRKSDMDNITRSSWDYVQHQFECCGVDSFSNWFGPEDSSVPDSCCIDHQPHCGEQKDPALWNQTGCLAKLMQFTTGDHLFIVACVIVGIVFIQLYGIITSLLLSSHIRKPKSPHPFHEYRYERANKGPTF